MKDKTVLILYGTRFGATKEVAMKIKKILEEKNIQTDVIDLKVDKQQELPKLGNYSGIIIATGIRMSMWVKEVKRFVKKAKNELKNYQGMKGFYVCSAFAADPEKYEKIKHEYITQRLEKHQLKFDLIEAFGGKIDMTPQSQLSWLDKKLVEIVSRQYEDVRNKTIDLIDWKQVEKFANEFATLIG